MLSWVEYLLTILDFFVVVFRKIGSHRSCKAVFECWSHLLNTVCHRGTAFGFRMKGTKRRQFSVTA
jgi:hypothetical protein